MISAKPSPFTSPADAMDVLNWASVCPAVTLQIGKAGVDISAGGRTCAESRGPWQARKPQTSDRNPSGAMFGVVQCNARFTGVRGMGQYRSGLVLERGFPGPSLRTKNSSSPAAEDMKHFMGGCDPFSCIDESDVFRGKASHSVIRKVGNVSFLSRFLGIVRVFVVQRHRDRTVLQSAPAFRMTS